MHSNFLMPISHQYICILCSKAKTGEEAYSVVVKIKRRLALIIHKVGGMLLCEPGILHLPSSFLISTLSLVFGFLRCSSLPAKMRVVQIFCCFQLNKKRKKKNTSCLWISFVLLYVTFSNPVIKRKISSWLSIHSHTRLVNRGVSSWEFLKRVT